MRVLHKGKLPILLIAIDGYGGSGKSTLANFLAKELRAEIIHTDDFASWENPEDWWPSLIEKVFNPIENGANLLNYTKSKWWDSHDPIPVTNQPITPLMILEGVFSLRKEFRPYINYSIFVETNSEISLQRGLERDKGRDNKTDEEIRHMWTKWRDSEEAYMERDVPKQFADLIVDGKRPLEPQLSELIDYLSKK